jgi:hypothetical protein
MNQGKYVFSQIVTFLPARIFDRCVSFFQGDKWVKYFTCWNQLMCMMFGQLSNRSGIDISPIKLIIYSSFLQ